MVSSGMNTTVKSSNSASEAINANEFPLAAITGVSLPTAELLATTFVTAAKFVAATEKEIAETRLKSGRRVGDVVVFLREIQHSIVILLLFLAHKQICP